MNEFSFGREISRKLFHILILILPTLLVILGRASTLKILIPLTVIFVGVDYMRRKNVKIKDYFQRIFAPILREKEMDGKSFCGASWTFISASIIFAICTEEIAVTAFAILAISDACAALIGKSFVSKPFFEKSTIGSLAFYISGLVVLFVCGGMFHSRLWFYLFGFFALFCATILEARPSFLNLDDNFSIPVSFALVMSFFDVMWNYSY